MVEDLFSSCLKTLGISEEMPFENLSYTEKEMFTLCHELSIGQDIDFNEINNVLDDEKKKRLVELLIKYYNL